MNDDKHEIAVFNDPRNITIGTARVIYAEATRPRAKAPVQAGWVLPGGERTDDYNEAVRVAQWIYENDKLSRAKR
jgi:hypothetical protein